MALIPIIIITGLVTLLIIAGWSTLGVTASIGVTILHVGLAIGLIRFLRTLGLAGTPDPSREATARRP